MTTAAQAQTADVFGHKWKHDANYEDGVIASIRTRAIEGFGDVANAPWFKGKMLDAGCGGGLTTLALFGDALKRISYFGIDISDAHEVCQVRFRAHGIDGRFERGDLMDLIAPYNEYDVIYSNGVLHHTDSTEKAIRALARHLKVDGRFLFYVYKTKGPIREFTDDYIRDILQVMTPGEALEAMKPLTKLGIALGELNVTVDIPEAIPLLGIPAGPIDIQRLFYWHVAKMVYRDDYSFEAMNLTNYDWYAPANAHRQTPEEVRSWCATAKLDIEREFVDDAGIFIVARRR